jgi:hypothetical protein
MKGALRTFLTMPLPTVAPVEVEMAAVQDALRDFHRRFDRLAESDTAVRDFLAVVAKQLTEDTGVLKLLQDRAANVAAARPATKQALETLQNAQAPYTTAALPLTRYVDQNQPWSSGTCHRSSSNGGHAWPLEWPIGSHSDNESHLWLDFTR